MARSRKKPRIHLDTLPPTVSAGEPVGIDCEGFHMDGRKLHRPIGDFASLQVSVGDDVYVLSKAADISKALRSVQKGLWVYHHAAFDIRHLGRWGRCPSLARPPVERMWDIMLVDQMMWAGYYKYSAFSLADIVRRRLDFKMLKAVRERFEDASELDRELIEYGAIDPWVTVQCQALQAAELADDHPLSDGFGWLWDMVEGPMVYVGLDRSAPLVNRKAWEKLALWYKGEMERIKTECDFNPGSPDQVRAAMLREGITVKNAQASTLDAYKDVSAVARNRLAYATAQNRFGTYGLRWMRDIDEDGRVYSDQHQIGTETGREAYSKPNLQNIPVRRTDDIRYRRCFVAPAGSSLAVLDYDQQETRILAQVSGDEALIAILRSGQDTHQAVADKVDTDRPGGKIINLAMPYGISARGLAEQLDCSEYQAETFLRSYFTEFPDVRTYLARQKSWGGSMGYVTSLKGRVQWLNPHDFQWPRNSSNGPIQMSAADMQKRAMVLFRDAWLRGKDTKNKPLPLVLSVHDEQVIELPRKDIRMGAAMLEQAMMEAAGEVCSDVPFAVGVKIGKTWAVGKEKG